MAEPDHLFVRPLPNLAHGEYPAGFPFFYIKPEENEKIVRKFYPEDNGPVTNVDPIGNSPVIIRKVKYSGTFSLRYFKMLLLLYIEKNFKFKIVVLHDFTHSNILFVFTIRITVFIFIFHNLFAREERERLSVD